MRDNATAISYGMKTNYFTRHQHKTHGRLIYLPQHFSKAAEMESREGRIIERDAVSAPIPCVMLTPGLRFPPLRSSKVTLYPQHYAGRDGNDRYEWQRPFRKRQIAPPRGKAGRAIAPGPQGPRGLIPPNSRSEGFINHTSSNFPKLNTRP